MKSHGEFVETVTGYEAALKEVRSWVSRFNECNGAGRAVMGAGLNAFDQEGSGEYCKAVCRNMNEAQSNADEIYDIFVLP